MQDILIRENGLNLLFRVDEEGRLLLAYASLTERELPERFGKEFCACQVQTLGDTERHCLGSSHNCHMCPDVPKYVSHTDTQNENGRLLCFTLQSSQLKMKQYYQFYHDIQVVRSWCETQNTCDETVGLTYVASFHLPNLGKRLETADSMILYMPHSGWTEELHWTRQTLRQAGLNPVRMPVGTKRITAGNTGAWPCKEYLPMGAVYDPEHNETVLWQIESGCSWHWEIGTNEHAMYLGLSGPTEAENSWYKALKPGESFVSVPAAVALAAGDFEGAVQEMTKYRRKIVDAGRIDEGMPVVFNDYMQCLNANPSTEKLLPLIDKAAELGAEVFCMDAGWYDTGDWWPTIGKWEICDARFTNGLKEIFDHIHSKGMIAGIWLEPESMGAQCPIAQEFADCFFMRHGKPVMIRGRYQLDMRKQKVIDHLNKVVDHLIDYLGVKFFKFDYNIEPGVGTETDADSFGDGLLQATQAFYAWVDSLYARHPGLRIECCASGGMRMEYAALKHFELVSVSDAALYNEFGYMGAMVPTAVLPEQSGIWVVPKTTQTLNENAYSAVNAMLCRFYVSGHTGWLEDDHFASLCQAVKVYKEIRGDLKDALPIYPDGICDFTSDWNIAGRICKDEKTVYLTIGHLNGEDEKRIPLAAFAGRMKRAQILYPSFAGSIRLEEDAIAVNVPQKAAILVKIELK